MLKIHLFKTLEILMRYFAKMSALLLTILSVSTACPMMNEIRPCKCKRDYSNSYLTVSCEYMGSFRNVTDTLKGHFAPTDRIRLQVAYSNLEDLSMGSFKSLNMTIENLKLNHDIFAGQLSEETFDGLTTLKDLNLADNTLGVVPEHIWKKLPNIKTLDMGRASIKELKDTSFRDLHYVENLVIPGNLISRMDEHSIPIQVRRLHIGRNLIRDLNRTLIHLVNLEWLFVNANGLTTLELPPVAPNMNLIHASDNQIEEMPKELKNYPNLESLFLQDNKITSLNGTLATSRKLLRVVLERNNIKEITVEDFAETYKLESLLLGYNQIKSLNGSLLNCRNLNFLNMTYNYLTEFSFQDIIGLQELASIDLSFNQIRTLIGPTAIPLFQNQVELNIKLTELKLDHNELESLNGALAGLSELLRLNLSFNRLKKIAPDDLIGLDKLILIDLSHNQLSTLEETSKTFLPRLSELRASHNLLTTLEKDFHGLPILCKADLSHNQITYLGKDLVSRTKCRHDNGVHEGTWDILEIELSGNPIMCDPALPEIRSAMEINHTRILESPCSNTNHLIIETSTPTPYILDSKDITSSTVTAATISVQSEHLLITKTFPTRSDKDDNSNNKSNPNNNDGNNRHDTDSNLEEPKPLLTIDPVKQGEQINKLESEVKQLREKLDHILLAQNLNNTLSINNNNKSTVKAADDKPVQQFLDADFNTQS